MPMGMAIFCLITVYGAAVLNVLLESFILTIKSNNIMNVSKLYVTNRQIVLMFIYTGLFVSIILMLFILFFCPLFNLALSCKRIKVNKNGMVICRSFGT